MKKIGEGIVFFRVESYFWVAKQVFWGAGAELPGCYGLSEGSDRVLIEGLTIGCAGCTTGVRNKEV